MRRKVLQVIIHMVDYAKSESKTTHVNLCLCNYAVVEISLLQNIIKYDCVMKFDDYLLFACNLSLLFITVLCSPNGSIRLVDGASEREGRVEVCMGGYWGSVCSDGWSEEDALVVCRQAGHNTLSELHFNHNYSYGICNAHAICPSHNSRTCSTN